MKKNVKYAIIGLIICLFLGVIAVKILFSPTEEEVSVHTEKYADYVCRDHHLVCLKRGESDGNYILETEGLSYSYRYNLIEDVEPEQFIFSRTTLKRFGAIGANLVLQSPKNEVNVLTDWNIESFQIYYIDPNAAGNSKLTVYDDKEEYVKQELISVSDEETLQEVAVLLNNKEPDVNFYATEEFRKYSYVYPKERTYYLRVLFEESESIGWETRICFHRMETDSTHVVLTLENGEPNEEYVDCGFETIIDSSSELYKVIWEVVKDDFSE